MKFNLKNLVLPISIITSICGNISNATDNKNNNIISINTNNDIKNTQVINNINDNITLNNNTNNTQQNNINQINMQLQNNNKLLENKRNTIKQNNTITYDELLHLKNVIQHWWKGITYSEKYDSVFKTLCEFAQKDDILQGLFSDSKTVCYKTEEVNNQARIIKIIGSYFSNTEDNWNKALEHDMIENLQNQSIDKNTNGNFRKDWFAKNQDNIDDLFYFSSLNRPVIPEDKITDMYLKYESLYRNMNLYFVQKIHHSMFTVHKNDNEFIKSVLFFMQNRYKEQNDNRCIKFNNLDEYQSIIKWLIYCGVKYETLSKFLFPGSKKRIKVRELLLYPAQSLLSFYIDEIDKKIKDKTNNNDKDNLIKEYIKNILSGHDYNMFKYTNRQALTPKISSYILAEYYLKKILSLASDIKLNSLNNKSFLQNYQQAIMITNRQQKINNNAQNFGPIMKSIVQLIQFVFKTTRQHMYEFLCNKYKITPDNEFINEIIRNNEYFNKFIRSFSIIKKVNEIFGDYNVALKVNLTKYLLFGCDNLGKQKEKNKMLTKIRSKYVQDFILSHLYDKEMNSKTGI